MASSATQDQTVVLKPSSAYFWMKILGNVQLLSFFSFTMFLLILTFWDVISPDKNDFVVEFIKTSKYSALFGISATIAVLICVGIVGIEALKYHRMRYILDKTGIRFGEGIVYKEDMVAWAIINDVDLTQSIAEQFLGIGTVWIATDSGVRKPLVYLNKYREVQEHFRSIVHQNYKNARRIARM